MLVPCVLSQVPRTSFNLRTCASQFWCDSTYSTCGTFEVHANAPVNLVVVGVVVTVVVVVCEVVADVV